MHELFRAWYSISCIVDPALAPEEIILPLALAELAKGLRVWVAPPEAPFFGTNLRVRGVCAGELARVSPRHRFGLEVLIHAADERLLSSRAAAPIPPELSLSIDDLRPPSNKAEEYQQLQKDLLEIHQLYVDGLITDGERYNKAIDCASVHGERVSSRAAQELSPRLRALLDAGMLTRRQLARLAGVTGLQAMPSGQLYERTIWANAADGWSPHDYFILAGASRHAQLKKGKQLGEAQRLWVKLSRILSEVTITSLDCEIQKGVSRPIDEHLRLCGRTFSSAEEIITRDRLDQLARSGLRRTAARFLPYCAAQSGVCARCYGIDPATGELPRLGTRVGSIAARAIAEAAAELTERTFSICGICNSFGHGADARASGIVRYHHSEIASFAIDGRESWIVVSPDAELHVETSGCDPQVVLIPEGAEVFFADGEAVLAGAQLARWHFEFARVADLPPEVEAVVELRDVEGLIEERLDEVTGLSSRRITRVPPERSPAIVLRFEGGERLCALEEDGSLRVEAGAIVRAGDPLATVRRRWRGGDRWAGGLDRLLELLEGHSSEYRTPIARAAGTVVTFGKQRAIVEDREGRRTHYRLRDTYGVVRAGDRVLPGDALQDGERDHHELLAIMGRDWLADHLETELHHVLGSQLAVHAELIVRALLGYMRVTRAGGSSFVDGEIVDRRRFEEARRVHAEDPPRAEPILLGISELASRALLPHP